MYSSFWWYTGELHVGCTQHVSTYEGEHRSLSPGSSRRRLLADQSESSVLSVLSAPPSPGPWPARREMCWRCFSGNLVYTRYTYTHIHVHTYICIHNHTHTQLPMYICTHTEILTYSHKHLNNTLHLHFELQTSHWLLLLAVLSGLLMLLSRWETQIMWGLSSYWTGNTCCSSHSMANLWGLSSPVHCPHHVTDWSSLGCLSSFISFR
jgi:hypothetical protein